jgi:uncharacterized protein YcgI (DUF1989 family)
MHSPHKPCERDNGDADTFNATLESPISQDGSPTPATTYVIPAREGRAVRLDAGNVLRIINTHGTQVCDMWAFNVEDLSEFFSGEHSRLAAARLNPKSGDVLLTNRRRPILEFVDDTSPGIHDTVIAACDIWRYRTLGVDGYHDNCSDNLRQALMAIGLRTREVPQPFNVWMNIPIGNDGSFSLEATVSKPGDYVEFKAMLDCVVVMSACPQDLNQVNGLQPRELEFVVSK